MTKAASKSGLADPNLLNKIDRLFECNVGKYIALPQIIVIGDQSSGKSSVLEGITGLPFPRDAGLCTRFATQITFRRSATESIAVSIIPAQDASPEHAALVSAWSKTDMHNLDAVTFAAIMLEAQQVMGITDSRTGTFSDDVLKLELSGPQHEHLSVGDVPGIFKRATEGLTTKKDIAMVRAMVMEKMSNPRSVMLTVIASNVDIATQEILEMAEEVDKEGIRTLGILTKPDLVDRGAEGRVVDLIDGKAHALKLGWHIVKNPGQAELEEKMDRDAIELKFFNTVAPWSKLEKDKVGITSLKLRLQEVLAGRVRREFPKVRMELQAQLKLCREQLEVLGYSRESSAEQRAFLLDMATQFQDLTQQALATQYSANDLLDRPELKIATLVRNRSESFARTFSHCAHTYEFDLGGVASETKVERPVARKTWMKMLTLLSRARFWNGLRISTNNSRGFELGTFQASILSNSMKKQAVKWEAISMGYINDVIVMVHKFITILLEHICPDNIVRGELMTVLMEKLAVQYRKAIEHVTFLLQIECNEHPRTLNNYFNMALQDSRKARHDQHSPGVSGDGPGVIEMLKALLISQDYNIQEIHDILKSYYQIARERFVDCTFKQAAGHCLVFGRDTPLRLFSPKFVSGLTEQQLEDIAGEDAGTKRKRKALQEQVEDLENGKKVLH